MKMGLVLLGIALHPARVGKVKVHIGLENVAQGTVGDEVLQRAEVAVESPI